MAGDAEALDALLTKIRPYLHALMRARLGSEPRAGLDNSALVQEALVRIYQNITRLREPSVPLLLAWVGRIVRNLVIDALRVHQHDAGRLPVPDPSDVWNKDSSNESQDRRDRRALRVAEALGRMPARRRQVIELSFFEKLSDTEIGRRLGGSEGAVRVLRFRALEDLRRLLASSPDSDCRPLCGRAEASKR
jgi:RNA polymerase sigma-70 factor (ECF subfamily)